MKEKTAILSTDNMLVNIRRENDGSTNDTMIIGKIADNPETVAILNIISSTYFLIDRSIIGLHIDNLIKINKTEIAR